MEIKGMRKVDFGKTVAFFSVEFSGHMTINDMKLIKGNNGVFAATPSRKYTAKDGTEKYQPIVYMEQGLLQKVSVAAELEYHNLVGKPQSSASVQEDIPF